MQLTCRFLKALPRLHEVGRSPIRSRLRYRPGRGVGSTIGRKEPLLGLRSEEIKAVEPGDRPSRLSAAVGSAPDREVRDIGSSAASSMWHGRRRCRGDRTVFSITIAFGEPGGRRFAISSATVCGRNARRKGRAVTSTSPGLRPTGP